MLVDRGRYAGHIERRDDGKGKLRDGLKPRATGRRLGSAVSTAASRGRTIRNPIKHREHQAEDVSPEIEEEVVLPIFEIRVPIWEQSRANRKRAPVHRRLTTPAAGKSKARDGEGVAVGKEDYREEKRESRSRERGSESRAL